MTSCFVRIHTALHPHRVNQASTHQAREERPEPPRPVIMFPLPGWRKRLSLQLVVKRRFLKMGLSFIAKSSFRYSQIHESSHRKKRMYEQDCQITVNGPPPIKTINELGKRRESVLRCRQRFSSDARFKLPTNQLPKKPES